MRRPLLLALALVACAGNPGPGEAMEVCTGQFVLFVTNDWTEAVEIYTTRGTQSLPQPVGTVLAGAREEFVLPGDTQRAWALALAGGQVRDIPRPYRRLVRIRHQCRGATSPPAGHDW